jgi:DNA-directed RNA polymerase specialized sigma24 family protein
MTHRTSRSKASGSTTTIEKLLESHYERLLKWGKVLARGDAGTAQEIVHDLCLYLVLTRPDFSGVTNLDGYLYTSLRHIYLSRIARSSREALRFMSVGDFDSVQFVFASTQPGKSVEMQNDLRNICCYSVWRKDSSKSFSYFILHFFHGYFPREIAEIACLPISAIYNKLKTSRTEMRAYLAAPNKLRSISQEIPPVPVFSRSQVSSTELFRELRETILQARMTECLLEEELLAHYRVALSSPLSSSLLSHIVSCERCLAVLDRHFRRPTLKDRDSLDGFDRALNMKSSGEEEADDLSVEEVLRRVLRHRERIYQHRPGTLSIAVNGKIIAFHDVRGEQSALSVRIERPESARFVEVFSEQDIRLALLPVADLPPEGPPALMQHISFSDGRWLELNLAFDGQGLQSEVAYFDPALSVQAEEDAEEAQPARFISDSPSGSSMMLSHPGLIVRVLRFLKPSPILAWTPAIVFFVCASGYLLHRYMKMPLDPVAILNRSMNLEAASEADNAEHQVLRLVEVTSDDRNISGTVDVWTDSDGGRYVRRLYNDQHRLIASEWRGKDGQVGFTAIPDSETVSATDRMLTHDGLWKQGLSARAFRALAEQKMQITATNDGYEVTTPVAENNPLHLASAVLVLDRHLAPVSETLRVRNDSGVREIRLVQTMAEHKPSSSVPDAVFGPESPGPVHPGGRAAPSGISNYNGQKISGTEVQLAQVEIAALYQLHQMGADIGEPIEIARTPDGYIGVYGTIADDARKAELLSRLEALPHQQLMKLRLRAQNDAQAPVPDSKRSAPSTSSVYSVAQAGAPADAILIRHFATDGRSSDQAKAAAMQFSQDALGHAQRALQHAYALQRLGNAFTDEQLRSVDPHFQQQWAEMTADHASMLQRELILLQDQLSGITLHDGDSPTLKDGNVPIDSLAIFAHATDKLLRQIQNLNRAIGSAFSSEISRKANENPDLLLSDAVNSIPLQEATELAQFSQRLSNLKGMKDGQNDTAVKQFDDPRR